MEGIDCLSVASRRFCRSPKSEVTPFKHESPGVAGKVYCSTFGHDLQSNLPAHSPRGSRADSFGCSPRPLTARWQLTSSTAVMENSQSRTSRWPCAVTKYSVMFSNLVIYVLCWGTGGASQAKLP